MGVSGLNYWLEMFCSSGSSPVPGDEEQTCGKRVPGSVLSLARRLGTIRKTPALPRPFHSSPGNQVKGHSRDLETRVHRPWEPGDCWAHWGEYSDQSLPAPMALAFPPHRELHGAQTMRPGLKYFSPHSPHAAGRRLPHNLRTCVEPTGYFSFCLFLPCERVILAIWGGGGGVGGRGEPRGSGDQFAPDSQGEVYVRFDSSPLGSHRHSLLAFC